jgi:glycoprotein 6-alpha-L-fucosyltransferase
MDAQAIQLPIVDSLHPRPDFMPLAIPADLAPRLNTFHGDAPVWWIGQMVKYLMRPNAQLQQDIEETSQRRNFQRPIVGLVSFDLL